MSAGLSLATIRQNTQPAITFPSRSCILAWLTISSRDQSLKEIVMGTCPKCKLRIRKNGNHVKLGSIWYHKMCPAKPARAAKSRGNAERHVRAKVTRAEYSNT